MGSGKRLSEPELAEILLLMLRTMGEPIKLAMSQHLLALEIEIQTLKNSVKLAQTLKD